MYTIYGCYKLTSLFLTPARTIKTQQCEQDRWFYDTVSTLYTVYHGIRLVTVIGSRCLYMTRSWPRRAPKHIKAHHVGTISRPNHLFKKKNTKTTRQWKKNLIWCEWVSGLAAFQKLKRSGKLLRFFNQKPQEAFFMCNKSHSVNTHRGVLWAFLALSINVIKFLLVLYSMAS